jgi:hypothetical protein
MDMQTLKDVFALLGLFYAALSAAEPILTAIAKRTATTVDDEAVGFLHTALVFVRQYGPNFNGKPKT